MSVWRARHYKEWTQMERYELGMKIADPERFTGKFLIYNFQLIGDNFQIKVLWCFTVIVYHVYVVIYLLF